MSQQQQTYNQTENHDVEVSAYYYNATHSDDGHQYAAYGGYDETFTQNDEGTVDTDKYERSMEPVND